MTIWSRMFTSCTFPWVMTATVGILPRRSRSVWILIAPLRFLNAAQGKRDRQRSMVVESRAYAACWSSMPKESWVYSFRALPCLLYTSDAADDLLCVDLGGRRIIKKKKR